MNKLPIAALAALFALGSSSAVILNSTRQAAVPHPGLLSSQPGLAAADRGENEHGENNQGDNNQGDEGHRDHGKHKGWYKHNRDDQHGPNGARGLNGSITGINGSMVTLRLSNGRYVTVNDQNALNNGTSPNLWVGENVHLGGNYGNNGVFYANSIAQQNGNNSYNNQSAYGGACGANYGGQSETVTGYATGGVDGNGNFGLQTTPLQNVPIPFGPRYTVHVSGSTCINGQQVGNVQLNLGRHIKVTGVAAGGNTINATSIWYV